MWCSGCHSPRINQGGAPEMGLIKGVGQGKQSQPTYQSTMSHAGSGGSQGQSTGQSQGEGIGDTHES